MWSLVARAYIQMAREWPQYALNVGSDSLVNIALVGKTLQQAIRNGNSLNGNPATPNQQLFTALSGKHKAKASALQQRISTYQANNFIRNNTCNSADYSRCIPVGVDLWSNPTEQTTHTPAVVIDGCDGNHPLHLALPSGLFYGVPTALLTADKKRGDLLSACITPSYTGSNPGGASIKNLKLTINISFSNAVVASLSLVAGGGAYWVCTSCGLDLSNNPWWFLEGPSQQVAQGWSVTRYPNESGKTFTLKGEFEDHARVTLTVAPWAQTLYETLESQRRSYYTQVAQQFKTPLGAEGLAIEQAGRELSATKTLITAYVNFSLPYSLQNNDVLRSLLYGTQSIFDADAVRSIYQAASSGTPPSPELDLTANTMPRITALDGVFTSALQGVSQGQSPESSIQIDTILSDIASFKNLLDASGRDGAGNPVGALSFCSYQVSPDFAVVDSAGANVQFRVQPAVGANCKWLTRTATPWLSSKWRSYASRGWNCQHRCDAERPVIPADGRLGHWRSGRSNRPACRSRFAEPD